MITPSHQRMRGIFVCTTFPAPHLPTRGLINLDHVTALSRHMDLRVLVPHSWFPCRGSSRWVPRRGFHRVCNGIEITDIRTWYLPLSRGPLNGRLYARCIRSRLNEMCESFRPDFLMTSFGFPDAVGVGAEARRLGLPFVTFLRGTDVHTYSRMPARWRAMVAAFKQAALVVPISEALAGPVLASGVDPARVHVVHYGVDQGTFRLRDKAEAGVELGLPSGRRRLLFVGNLMPVKHVPALLGAFAILVDGGHSDVDLFLIGEGPCRREIEAFVASRNFANRVTLLGGKSHEEVARWIGASDVVCLSSRNEGIPNVVLESLASGRPVVSTRVGGVPDVVREGQTGFLVPDGDIPALAEALAKALERRWDPVALRDSVAMFDWEMNARETTRLIRDAVSVKSIGRRAQGEE